MEVRVGNDGKEDSNPGNRGKESKSNPGDGGKVSM